MKYSYPRSHVSDAQQEATKKAEGVPPLLDGAQWSHIFLTFPLPEAWLFTFEGLPL